MLPFPALPPERRGHVHTLRVHAACLADNPWGDPCDRDVLVHVPAGDHDRLPAVMVLPGFAGTHDAVLGGGLLEPSFPNRLDRLFADGCPPFLTVFPDLMTSVGGSQFVDSPGIGRYLDALVHVVRPAVDSHFETTLRWGATGRSSGALGALHFALAAPQHVRAVAWHAGDCGFDLCYLGDIGPAIRGLQAAGGVEAFLNGFWTRRRVDGDAFAALNLLAMACAYSPDADRRPLPARLPFDPETGAVDFDVLRAWQRHDPIRRVTDDPSVAQTLRALDLLLLDAGDRDEYLLHLGARRLSAALTAADVRHSYTEFSGGHRGTSWRYDLSLPLLARALHGETVAGW